jgi:hypothetical protein
MGVPFCVQKLILKLKQDYSNAKKMELEEKAYFCNAFEKELSLPVSDYSEQVFDYIFNLFYSKNAFKFNEFQEYLDEVLSLDYKRTVFVAAFFNEKYGKMVTIYPEFFAKHLGIDASKDMLTNFRKISKEVRENGKIQFKIRAETLEKIWSYENALN